MDSGLVHDIRAMKNPILLGAAAFGLGLFVWVELPHQFSVVDGFYWMLFAIAMILSCLLWASAYVTLHGALIFLPSRHRPLLAFVWGLGWFCLAYLLKFIFLLPLIWWSSGAYVFTVVTASAHWVAMRGIASPAPPPIPATSAPPSVSTASTGAETPPSPEADVSPRAGLALAMPAILLSGLAIAAQAYARHIEDVGLPAIIVMLLSFLPCSFPYLASYLLLFFLKPAFRPLLAPVWGLGWFALMIFYFIIPYFHTYGARYLLYVYEFTCLTAAIHLGLMFAYRRLISRGLASGA
jgi:hypothetical protein